MNKQFFLAFCFLFPAFLISQAEKMGVEYELSDTTVAQTLLGEADILLEDEKPEEALEKITKAKAILTTVLGAGVAEVIECWDRISKVYSSQRKYEDAKKTMDTTLALRLTLLGELDRVVADTYQSLGVILHKQRKYEDAIRYLENSLSIYRKATEVDPSDIAMSYRYLGLVLLDQAKYEIAAKNINKALEIQLRQFGEVHSDVADSYNVLGAIMHSNGKYDLIQQYWQKALDIRLQVLDELHPDVADSYSNMGIASYVHREFDLAIQYFEKALDIQLKVLDNLDPRVPRTISSLGIIYYGQGDYAKAVEYYRMALDIQVKILDLSDPRISHNYNNMGVAFLMQGKYERASQQFEKAINLRLKAYGDLHPYVADSYNNMGLARMKQGKGDLAIQYYEKALDIWLKAKGSSHPNVGAIYNNLGLILKSQGKYDLAIKYHEKNLEIKLRFKDTLDVGIGETYSNLGRVYYAKGEYDKALEYYEKDLEIRIQVSDDVHHSAANPYNNIGLVFNQRGRHDLAIQNCNKALEIKLKSLGNVHPDVAMSYNTLADILLKNKEYEVAIQYYENALLANNYFGVDSLRKVSSLPTLIHTHKSMGICHQELYKDSGKVSHLFQSEDHLQKATLILDYLSKTIGDQDKTQLAKDTYAVYDAAISTHFLLSSATDSIRYLRDAFIYSERSKSYLLLESMQESDARAFAQLPDSLLRKEYTMRTDIAFYEKKRQEKLSDGLGEADSSVLTISGQLFDLKRDYESLKANFERNYHEYYRLKYDLTTVDVKDIQRDLVDADQSLLEYFVGDSSIFAFVINGDSYNVHEIKKDFPLEEWVATFRKSNNKDHYQMMTSEYCQVAHHLYRKLIDPVVKDLKQKVIIIPDGLLGYIPFEALLVEPVSKPNRWKGHHYLIRDKQISYSYSATLLKQMKEKMHKVAPPKDFLAFAPYYDGDTTQLAALFRYAEAEDKMPLRPLPSSGEEVLGIQKIMGGDVYYNENATEDRFASIAGHYRVVHLASHARANDKMGNYSYLAFTEQKDSIENELLYVRDLYNLQLNADLVVLSACETGIGELKHGEGIIGLTRGFTFAGAKSLVTSLWSVSDRSTSELMITFYKYLNHGMTKDGALRQAKLDHITDLDRTEATRAHPFYWSSFIAVGDMSPFHMRY